MARRNNIKGITIEINGDVTKLDKALASVDKELNTTQKNLKEVERLLKLDPRNVELLDQKQRLLSKAVEETGKRYDTLKKALNDATASNVQAEKWAEAQKQFSAEITRTENALSNLIQEQKRMEGLKFAPDSAELADLQKQIDATRQKSEDLRRQSAQTFEELGRPISIEQYDALQRELVQSKHDMDEAEKSARLFDAGLDEMGAQSEDTSGLIGEFTGALNKLGITVTFDLVSAMQLAADAIKALADFTADAIKGAAEYADNILTMSTNFGIAADKLQEYQYMSELVDTDVETITGSLSKLTRSMDAARSGTGDAAEAFAKLNIRVTDSEGRLRNADEVFEQAIGSLSMIEDGSERDAIAMTLFGRSAQELNSLISAVANGSFKELQEESHRLHYVLSKEELDALGQVDDGFQRLDRAMEMAKNRIAIQLAPTIVDLTDRMLNLIEKTDWDAFGRGIATTVETVVPLIVGLAKAIATAAEAVAELIQWLDKLSVKDASDRMMSGYNNRRGGHGSRQVGIPAYASGGVIEPNNPMLALVGDNKSEREVITPESLMRRVVREESGGGRGGVEVVAEFRGTDDQLVRLLAPKLRAYWATEGAVL